MRSALFEATRNAATAVGAGLLALTGMLAAGEVLPDDRGFAAATLGLALAALAWGRARPLPHAPPLAVAWARRQRLATLGAIAAGGVFAFGWVAFGAGDDGWRGFGLLATVLAVFAVVCTGMVHLCHDEVPAWSNRWSLRVLLAISVAAGALWLNALALMFGSPGPELAMVVVLSLFFGFYVKRRYWRLLDLINDTPPDHEIAGHRRTIFICLFAAPLALSLLGMGNVPWLALGCAALAALSATAGLLTERWLFVAEGRIAAPPAPESD